ncbi:hypothetical protein PSE_4007 [Pseudovibrio sp. FO-BEG1]|nr:hypothetical protein PSE_4007 [Pseudovibrio sp. FO-BEG1]
MLGAFLLGEEESFFSEFMRSWHCCPLQLSMQQCIEKQT